MAADRQERAATEDVLAACAAIVVRGEPLADLPVAAAIAERFAQATDAGHGEEDMAATYRLSRPR